MLIRIDGDSLLFDGVITLKQSAHDPIAFAGRFGTTGTKALGRFSIIKTRLRDRLPSPDLTGHRLLGLIFRVGA